MDLSPFLNGVEKEYCVTVHTFKCVAQSFVVVSRIRNFQLQDFRIRCGIVASIVTGYLDGGAVVSHLKGIMYDN